MKAVTFLLRINIEQTQLCRGCSAQARQPPSGYSQTGQFFFEGPRSRSYGRTAALRLIVQPCDEDDFFFFVFQSNGAPVE
jgi:hypothetical protein